MWSVILFLFEDIFAKKIQVSTHFQRQQFWNMQYDFEKVSPLRGSNIAEDRVDWAESPCQADPNLVDS